MKKAASISLCMLLALGLGACSSAKISPEEMRAQVDFNRLAQPAQCVRDEAPIHITAVDKSGDIFSEDFTISGKLHSECLREAALYQQGRKVADLLTEDSKHERDSNFEVEVDASAEPVIRARALNGATVSLPIDVLDYRG